MHDVIVVGARVAGASVARQLASQGYQVLMVDRDHFPSDTISTHILLPKGYAQLKKWDLDQNILATNCPVIQKITFDAGPFALTGTPPPYQGNAEVIAPRRYFLDQLLIDSAIEAGVEFREGCNVEEIVTEEGRITGITFTSTSGNRITEKGHIIIGADGKNSIVARTAKAEEYYSQPKLSCWYYSYWSNVPCHELALYSVPHRAIGLIPTNNDLVCIPVSWPASEFQKVRADVEGNYMAAISLSEKLSDLMANAKREERFTGMADLPGFFKKPYGPGWALIGDAGYHKDPITGQGMSDALIYAEYLADAIDMVFKGEQTWDEALAAFQHRRDDEVLPMYQLTCEWATHAPPPPEVEAFLSSLQGRQHEINQYIGTIAGTVSIADYYTPENMGRIAGMVV